MMFKSGEVHLEPKSLAKNIATTDLDRLVDQPVAVGDLPVQGQLAAVSDGLAFSFPPPAIPGIGTSGGVTMILQDRSGNDDPTFLTKNLGAYLGALSKRKEIAAALP